MPIGPNEDEEQASLLAQRELAKALRLSLQAVAHEPLPQRMIILLLRLAFAQTVRATLGSKAERASRSKHQQSQDVQVPTDARPVSKNDNV
jgi:hypothetical protein